MDWFLCNNGLRLERVKFDIAWFVLWSLAQKEVLNLLHTYVVVLTLGTHNPCNRRYLLHI